MTRLRIYVRLSDAKGEDISIDRQLRLAHQFAKDHPELEHECARDDYSEGKGRHSGSDDRHRPKWRKLLTDIGADPTAGVLWAYDLSRITRGDDLMTLLKTLKRQRQTVETYRDDVDLESLSGKTAIRVKQLLNAIYRDDLADRHRIRLEDARREGWITSPVGCCGLEISGSKAQRAYHASLKGTWIAGPHVVLGKADERPFADNTEAFFRSYLDSVRRACELISSGLTLHATALAMRADRYYWNDRSDLPIPVNTYHILAGRLLATLPRYAPFIGQALVDSTLRRVSERTKRKGNGRPMAPEKRPALYRLVYCDKCKKRMAFSRHKFKHDLGYYHHAPGIACLPAYYVNYKRFEPVVLAEIGSRFSYTPEQLATIRQELEQEAQAPRRDRARDRRREIEKELANAKRLLFKEVIKEEDYLVFQRECNEELAELSRRPPENAPVPVDPARILAILSDFPAMLASATNAERNLLLRDLIQAVYVNADGSFRVEWQEWVDKYVR